MKTVLAFFVAIAVPVCSVTGWYLWDQFATFERDDPYIWVRTGHFLVLCALISAGHVVVLGAPAYAVLRWRKAVHWWSAVCTGAVLGAAPLAVLSWPMYNSPVSASVDGVQTIVNGVATLAGWLQYLESILLFAACGAAAATAFWLTARSPNNSSKRTRVPRAA
jgi:hypothetical protein